MAAVLGRESDLRLAAPPPTGGRVQVRAGLQFSGYHSLVTEECQGFKLLATVQVAVSL